MSVILRLIVPLNGTECVDAYKVTVIINEWTLFNEMKVTNHTQNRYMFEFPLDACDYASLSNVTAVAMTGGIEGSRAMLSVIDSMCKFKILIIHSLNIILRPIARPSEKRCYNSVYIRFTY